MRSLEIQRGILPSHLKTTFVERCWRGGGGFLLWALKKCLLNGYLIVCTFFLPYYRSTFTRSPVSVSSLLETFLGPAQDCSVLVNRGGGFGRKFGSPSRQGLTGPPLDLYHPTTRGPYWPPGTLSALATVLTPVSWDQHGDSSFQGPPAWRICAIGPHFYLLIFHFLNQIMKFLRSYYEILWHWIFF